MEYVVLVVGVGGMSIGVIYMVVRWWKNRGKWWG
jgi:hypothetical protein